MSRSTTKPNTVTLYRPVGHAELDLITASGYRRFPPRLPEQPIFYPVCNEDEEYWIPADDLDAFNDAIVGPIEVVRTFRGGSPGAQG